MAIRFDAGAALDCAKSGMFGAMVSESIIASKTIIGFRIEAPPLEGFYRSPESLH
jgi:hypothetical protein